MESERAFLVRAHWRCKISCDKILRLTISDVKFITSRFSMSSLVANKYIGTSRVVIIARFISQGGVVAAGCVCLQCPDPTCGVVAAGCVVV